jgi:hypothetical protein
VKIDIHAAIWEDNKEHYTHMCYNPHRGYCGIKRMLFTVGLFYNIYPFPSSAEGRYCFHTLADAVDALKNWDGVDDPVGDWIKHFGQSGEYHHPDATDQYAIKKTNKHPL